jgi:hypothetical protein
MSTPVIQYLRLDAYNDPIFDPTANLTNADAVAQAMLTRLRLFYGEWWESVTTGLPVFQSMLGQLGSTTRQAAMQLAVKQRIEGTPYVTSATGIAVSFVDGKFTFKADAATYFGPVAVATVPGLSAALDT